MLRFLVCLVILTAAQTALAQYNWGYAPGAPAYPPPAYPPRYLQPQPTHDLASEMLGAHNAVRARVGSPPLVWSTQLAEYAHRWASHPIATHQFMHSSERRYGENIYAISGGFASTMQVVASWADEARGYSLRTNGCASVCGHYTQIIWGTTRGVGCAVATGIGRQVWVCEYDPPGNIVGQRPY